MGHLQMLISAPVSAPGAPASPSQGSSYCCDLPCLFALLTYLVVKYSESNTAREGDLNSSVPRKANTYSLPVHQETKYAERQTEILEREMSVTAFSSLILFNL